MLARLRGFHGISFTPVFSAVAVPDAAAAQARVCWPTAAAQAQSLLLGELIIQEALHLVPPSLPIPCRTRCYPPAAAGAVDRLIALPNDKATYCDS